QAGSTASPVLKTGGPTRRPDASGASIASHFIAAEHSSFETRARRTVPVDRPPLCLADEDRAYPPLNGEMRGFVPEYRPAGFGYQIQTCSVKRSGCQKLNGDPVSGLVGGQLFGSCSRMNVPSL